MGPFVPDLISDQLNLIVALVIGIAFGAVLEQAGFSSSRRLAGVFYGYDFTVLRVFFTAAVTAMSGVLLLGYFGYLDTEMIYVNPMWLMPAIVGGGIMGVGFILGGYCPGTSICAMAIGKVDAAFFVLGGIVGVFGFGELYSLYKGFYESTSLGSIKVFDSLGMSQGLFALLLIVIAVGAFAITTVIEKNVDPKGAPSFRFNSRRHFVSGFAVIALGFVFAFLPDRKTHLIDEVSSSGYVAGHPIKRISPDDLAFRIVDKDPSIQIIDVRAPEEFGKLSLPGSVNIQLHDFFGKELNSTLPMRHSKRVVVAKNDSIGELASLLLERLGYENTTMLAGGLENFNRTILSGPPFIFSNSRWDNDVRQFRESARLSILKMMEEGRQTAKVSKKEKKIQGGC